MAALDGSRISFILSAGRTGTSFLAFVCPVLTPHRQYVQEPPWSRSIFMLSNAASAGWVSPHWAERLFVHNRARRLAAIGTPFEMVEINPFLAPLTPRIPDLVLSSRIVHMVRDPRSWIASMANFKAWGWRRAAIDWVPFTQTVHPAARSYWRQLDTIRRYAWRWRLANEQIEASRGRCHHYVMVRYEDLFSIDRTTRSQALKSILTTLGAEHEIDDSAIPWDTVVNPSIEHELDSWESWSADAKREVADIVALLMRRFGYDTEAPPLRVRYSAR